MIRLRNNKKTCIFPILYAMCYFVVEPPSTATQYFLLTYSELLLKSVMKEYIYLVVDLLRF